MDKAEWIETLYYYDGPVVFVGMLGDTKRLFCGYREKGEQRSFLAAEVSEEVLDALKCGGISIRGALYESGDVLTVDLVPNLSVVSVGMVDLSAMEDDLPRRGYGISRKFGRCPDHLMTLGCSV